ncbi:rhodopsin-like orphan GPCR [Clonorchis sinensis]|uniref:Rhodopsin-like orphan GPCR n=1 Tax=Clonorchis sinensis TaxID=79923 RepID=H2KPR5_CLOSI|nr:rhodopsin-like orphan GPCR [Clonorchis sinensis]
MTNHGYAYLYKNLTDYFLKWYIPAVLVSGFVGTAFCFLFLFRSKMFPRNMRVWLICICIGDFLVLLLEGIWIFCKVWYKYDYRDVNTVICKFHISAANYCLYWSAYVQCMMSMQRCYAILNPLGVKANHLSLRNLLICLLVVSLLLVLPILPYLVNWEVINGDCDPKNQNIYQLTTIFDFTIWGLIPLVIMTTSTIIIWKNLSQRRNCFDAQGKYLSSPTCGQTPTNGSKNSELRSEKSPRKIHPSSSDSSLKHLETGLSRHRYVSIPDTRIQPVQRELKKVCGEGQQPKRRISSETHNHVTRLLICMNFVYIASVYPLIIYFLFLNFVIHKLDKDIHRFCYYLFRSLCFLNACTNWIFYCVAGTKFRRQARHLLIIVCSRRLCKCCNINRSKITDSLSVSRNSRRQHAELTRQAVSDSRFNVKLSELQDSAQGAVPV